MKTKSFIPVIFLIFFSSSVLAQPTIGLEFLWGIGESSSNKASSYSKYCKNRSWSRLKGLGFYVSDDNLEAHVSRYKHDSDEACNRSNWVLGIGPKLSSRKDGKSTDKYLEWSPGVAYRFNETWRDHGNFSFYNRIRAGVRLNKGKNHQTSLEVGHLQYGGFFEDHHGESFLTVGLSRSDINRINHPEVVSKEEKEDKEGSKDKEDKTKEEDKDDSGQGSDDNEGDNGNNDDDEGNGGDENNNDEDDNTDNDNGNDNDDSGDDQGDDGDNNEGDKDKGHGNDDDKHDEDNPGKALGKDKEKKSKKSKDK